jgi:hypothetical protein
VTPPFKGTSRAMSAIRAQWTTFARDSDGAGQRAASLQAASQISLPTRVWHTRPAVAILEPWSVLRPWDFAWALAGY